LWQQRSYEQWQLAGDAAVDDPEDVFELEDEDEDDGVLQNDLAYANSEAQRIAQWEKMMGLDPVDDDLAPDRSIEARPAPRPQPGLPSSVISMDMDIDVDEAMAEEDLDGQWFGEP